MTPRHPSMLNDRDRRYVGADAAFMINIAKHCSGAPSTISAFIADVLSGSSEAVIPDKMRRAATYHANKVASFAACFASLLPS